MTKDIHFSYAKAVTAEAVAAYKAQVAQAQDQLVNGTGKGNDFLGWMNLPADIRPQLADIQATADLLRRECEVIVCIGIGGSYLGAKAVIDALTSSFAWRISESIAKILNLPMARTPYFFLSMVPRAKSMPEPSVSCPA